MTVQTEHIASELKRIRARCTDDIAVLMAPLLYAIESDRIGTTDGQQPTELAAMAASLAQVAAQAGDVETAVAIASLQAEIEGIRLGDRPAAGATAETSPLAETGLDAAATPRRRSLAAEYPLALMLGLLAAGAISYGVHVWTQARFSPGSLVGWLLSASTTLLAVALSLRLGGLLAVRLPRRRLNIFSATVAGLACILALTSFLIHRSEFVFPPTPAMEMAATTGNSAGNAALTSDSGHTTQSTGSAQTTPTPVDPQISIWWLGDAAPASIGAPATAMIDAEAVTGADGNADAGADADVGSEVGAPSSPERGELARAPAQPPPLPRPPGVPERYAALLQRQVRLVDSQGKIHLGTLTGVSKDSVTLYTQVMMFGQPVPAHRQFLHSTIRSLESQ